MTPPFLDELLRFVRVELASERQSRVIVVTNLNAENAGIDKQAPNYRAMGQAIAAVGADCVAYAGITADNAVQLFKDVAAIAA